MDADRLVFLAASATTVAGAVIGNERMQQVAKPLIAPSLAVRAWRKRGPDNLETALLVGGLTAAAVGDVLLIDPDDDRRLVQGASSFAVMQAGYTTLLLRHGARPTAPAWLPRLLGWAGAAVLLRTKAPTVAAPLTAYGVTLGAATTLASDPALDKQLFAGAQLFTVSDGLILVRRIFVRNETGRRIAEGVILATYAAAQALLVDGLQALR
ncbi:lysoplasmalogenase [Antrihabitans cavernicola]|uniref:Lysoplasmalogenase n=1 Tax=Antrihabitans cavernicola TaxID=2495913 RepID=A0A5A7S6R5_9NOCA|nr:lysoplasmalogenase [Spelaeibacter cavernicola]KAA0018965.1 lysoplasmalogenase [Spelaeibacter cavernicola]